MLFIVELKLSDGARLIEAVLLEILFGRLHRHDAARRHILQLLEQAVDARGARAGVDRLGDLIEQELFVGRVELDLLGIIRARKVQALELRRQRRLVAFVVLARQIRNRKHGRVDKVVLRFRQIG